LRSTGERNSIRQPNRRFDRSTKKFEKFYSILNPCAISKIRVFESNRFDSIRSIRSIRIDSNSTIRSFDSKISIRRIRFERKFEIPADHSFVEDSIEIDSTNFEPIRFDSNASIRAKSNFERKRSDRISFAIRFPIRIRQDDFRFDRTIRSRFDQTIPHRRIRPRIRNSIRDSYDSDSIDPKIGDSNSNFVRFYSFEDSTIEFDSIAERTIRSIRNRIRSTIENDSIYPIHSIRIRKNWFDSIRSFRDSTRFDRILFVRRFEIRRIFDSIPEFSNRFDSIFEFEDFVRRKFDSTSIRRDSSISTFISNGSISGYRFRRYFDIDAIRFSIFDEDRFSTDDSIRFDSESTIRLDSILIRRENSIRFRFDSTIPTIHRFDSIRFDSNSISQFEVPIERNSIDSNFDSKFDSIRRFDKKNSIENSRFRFRRKIRTSISAFDSTIYDCEFRKFDRDFDRKFDFDSHFENDENFDEFDNRDDRFDSHSTNSTVRDHSDRTPIEFDYLCDSEFDSIDSPTRRNFDSFESILIPNFDRRFRNSISTRNDSNFDCEGIRIEPIRFENRFRFRFDDFRIRNDRTTFYDACEIRFDGRPKFVRFDDDDSTIRSIRFERFDDFETIRSDSTYSTSNSCLRRKDLTFDERRFRFSNFEPISKSLFESGKRDSDRFEFDSDSKISIRFDSIERFESTRFDTSNFARFDLSIDSTSEIRRIDSIRIREFRIDEFDSEPNFDSILIPSRRIRFERFDATFRRIRHFGSNSTELDRLDFDRSIRNSIRPTKNFDTFEFARTIRILREFRRFRKFDSNSTFDDFYSISKEAIRFDDDFALRF